MVEIPSSFCGQTSSTSRCSNSCGSAVITAIPIHSTDALVFLNQRAISLILSPNQRCWCEYVPSLFSKGVGKLLSRRILHSLSAQVVYRRQVALPMGSILCVFRVVRPCRWLVLAHRSLRFIVSLPQAKNNSLDKNEWSHVGQGRPAKRRNVWQRYPQKTAFRNPPRGLYGNDHCAYV